MDAAFRVILNSVPILQFWQEHFLEICSQMRYILFLSLFLLNFFCHAQAFHALENGLDLTLESKYLGHELRFSLYLPKSRKVSDSLKYPVAIVFDRQNERTSNFTVQTIDYLTASFSIPEFIVVTIEQRNRFFETSVTMTEKGSGGIDLFLDCILTEMDSLLKAKFRANDYKLLIGHSRTAFLSIYALAKFPNRINACLANSPFFVEPAINSKVDLIKDLEASMQQSAGNRYLSFSVGDSVKDPHYGFYNPAFERLKGINFQEKFHWNSKMHPFADHYTVVGLHSSAALAWIYHEYARVLDNFIAMNNKSSCNVEWLKAQMETVSAHYGASFAPNLVHINSIASYFAQENQQQRAIEILEYGLSNYPKDADLYAFIGSLYKDLGEKEKAAKFLKKALAFIDLSPWYSSIEKKELSQELKSELKKLKD